jgi:hypothetical protein
MNILIVEEDGNDFQQVFFQTQVGKRRGRQQQMRLDIGIKVQHARHDHVWPLWMTSADHLTSGNLAKRAAPSLTMLIAAAHST